MPKILKLSFVVVIFFATIILILFFSPLFKVKSVEVIGAQECLNSDELKKDKSLIGQNLVLLSLANLNSEFITKYSCLEEVTAKKLYPSKLQIFVKSKLAVVKIDNSNFSLTLDGLVVDSQKSLAIPTIFLPTNINAQKNQKITDAKIIFAINLIKALTKSDFVVASLRFVADTIVVYNREDAIAIFSPQKDLNRQVDSLQKVAATAKIDATKIAKIDLRFDKPVIVYNYNSIRNLP